MADEKNSGNEAELIDNGYVVQSFWNIVNNDASSVEQIPGFVKKILLTGAWRRRIQRGKILENETFAKFITGKPLAGCGWSLDKVRKLIEDDPEALAMWRDAVTPPLGSNQHTDNISTHKDGHGTSKSYTVSRLRKNAPALYERVKKGELSANAAAIEAGFRKPPPKPFEQVKKLISKLSPEERSKLKAML